MKKDCNIYYLEMHEAPMLPQNIDTNLTLKALKKQTNAKRYFQLYDGVGSAYQWTDRHALAKDQLEAIINSNSTQIFTLNVKDEEVGFVEFILNENFVEILYFGLFPTAIGKGWGPQFLQLAINQAWSYHPPKVQLNTCDWDHPKALATYLKAGFKEVRRAVKS